jgi:hypothetical protein
MTGAPIAGFTGDHSNLRSSRSMMTKVMPWSAVPSDFMPWIRWVVATLMPATSR